MLYPGEPQCAPSLTVTIEAIIALLRMLHSHAVWTEHVNRAILTRLKHAGKLADMISEMGVGKGKGGEEEGGKEDSGTTGSQGEMSSGTVEGQVEDGTGLGECYK